MEVVGWSWSFRKEQLDVQSLSKFDMFEKLNCFTYPNDVIPWVTDTIPSSDGSTGGIVFSILSDAAAGHLKDEIR